MVSCIKDNLERIGEAMENAAIRSGRAAGEVRLVVVAKTRTVDEIAEVVLCGVKEIGENRAQELEEKRRLWSGGDVVWRFIGHLQRNKVRKAIEFASTVDSVDSTRLAGTLSRVAMEKELVLPSGEESKHGVDPSRARELVEFVVEDCPGLKLDGLMTIGPLTDDESAVRRAFSSLREIRDEMSRDFELPLAELSMGMSGDFELAIQEGSTMVRIGSAVFGSRH